MRPQHTLAQPISCTGVGLHTGQPVSLKLRPAPPDTGVVFVRQSGHGHTRVQATVENLVRAELCTAISLNGTSVKTIEHVLSALAGLEVDNVYVDLDADEVPVMDGSAGPFVRMIRAAGVVPQGRRQPYLKILHPIELTDGDRSIVVTPSPQTKFSYAIEYDHPLIGSQSCNFDWSVMAFEQHIAEARTFGFLKEVEYLWSRGLGKGGSLDNTVVLTDSGVLNDRGLRYQDEFVRHKVLDLIGDLALLGVPIIGHFTAHRSGHALHTLLVERILEQPDKWVLLTGGEKAMPERLPSLKAVQARAQQVLSPAVPLSVSPAL